MRLTEQESYPLLNQLAADMNAEDHHLKHLINADNRLDEFSLRIPGFFFDYSKQRIIASVKTALVDIATASGCLSVFNLMTTGHMVNTTENRAALHTAARDKTDTPIFLNGIDVKQQMRRVNENIKAFVHNIHTGQITGSTGKTFTDAVILGIGGSYLGCDFVYQALKHYQSPRIKLHFVPNVDIDNFGQTIKSIDPEKTIWVVISKSYTTTETMANLSQALLFIKSHSLDPKDHVVTVTSKGSPGDDPSNPVLESFHMFDFIGGRYSVTSAVGGLPLSLAFGFDLFDRFLAGCNRMDAHAKEATAQNNIPLTAALISIWNSNFLNYPTQAIIPYSSALSKLAPHVQQVYMESLGKSVTADGEILDNQTGVILFGEPGTNAQHSFFQLAHQGSPFPIEFIGIVNPVFDQEMAISKGVNNHQELWANMIAQSNAMAVGKTDQHPAKVFSGNRPSSTIIIKDLSPESIGLLLAFYEARTIFEGFILGLNPFDQPGVELGKILATGIRNEIEQKNRVADYRFDASDHATRFYLDLLFNGTL